MNKSLFKVIGVVISIIIICFMVIEEKKLPEVSWINVDRVGEEARLSKTNGKWLSLKKVLKLSKKRDAFSWKDLKKYNNYELFREEEYVRVYEIEDFDGLFELHVIWYSLRNSRPLNETVDPAETRKLKEVLLIANDGLGSYVDIRTGDVDTYIKEHQENMISRNYSFSYFKEEVKGPSETSNRIMELIEEGEEYLVNGKDEVVCIKIDNSNELDAFIEMMEQELQFADSGIKENIYETISKKLGRRSVKPQFILYFPQENPPQEYIITEVKRNGGDLYIYLEKAIREIMNAEFGGCLIGLDIQKEGNDVYAAKGISRVHIDIISRKYESVERVRLRLGYPPYKGYSLSTAEINDFIGCLEKIDISEIEIENVVPEGNSVECFITVEEELYELRFLNPYVEIKGNWYQINTEHEIFQIIEKILQVYSEGIYESNEDQQNDVFKTCYKENLVL